MSWLSKLFGGDSGSNYGDIKIPEFYQDPYYQKTQDVLFPFGTDLLSGNIPDYYKSIGESGGSEFQTLMQSVNKATMQGVTEDLARRNVRGGLGAGVAAKAMSDVNAQYGYQDYTRAQQGKQSLLGYGLNTLSGVQSSALSNQSQRNSYNLGSTELAMKLMGLENDQEAQDNAMWSSLLSSGIGVAGNLYGMSLLNKVLNPTGYDIGGLNLGSANTNTTSKLLDQLRILR